MASSGSCAQVLAFLGETRWRHPLRSKLELDKVEAELLTEFIAHLICLYATVGRRVRCAATRHSALVHHYGIYSGRKTLLKH